MAKNEEMRKLWQSITARAADVVRRSKIDKDLCMPCAQENGCDDITEYVELCKAIKEYDD